MRKPAKSIENIKTKVDELKGKKVKVRLNKGRNKICYFTGMIGETYPSVFIIEIFDGVFDRLSCTYQDVLCGDVKFRCLD